MFGERALRWFRHRIPRLACKVEYPGHGTGQRIERSVTIKAVIGRRLAAMRLLGREMLKPPAEVFSAPA